MNPVGEKTELPGTTDLFEPKHCIKYHARHSASDNPLIVSGM